MIDSMLLHVSKKFRQAKFRDGTSYRVSILEDWRWIGITRIQAWKSKASGDARLVVICDVDSHFYATCCKDIGSVTYNMGMFKNATIESIRRLPRDHTNYDNHVNIAINGQLNESFFDEPEETEVLAAHLSAAHAPPPIFGGSIIRAVLEAIDPYIDGMLDDLRANFTKSSAPVDIGLHGVRRAYLERDIFRYHCPVVLVVVCDEGSNFDVSAWEWFKKLGTVHRNDRTARSQYMITTDALQNAFLESRTTLRECLAFDPGTPRGIMEFKSGTPEVEHRIVSDVFGTTKRTSV